MKDQFPNLSHVKGIQCPLYIVHGAKDNLIPLEQSQMLVSYSSSRHTGFNFPPEMTHNRFDHFLDVIQPFLTFSANNGLVPSGLTQKNGLPQKYFSYGLVEGKKNLELGNHTCLSESLTETSSVIAETKTFSPK